MEEALEPQTGLCFVGATWVVLQTVGKHELHICDIFRSSLVFIVVDLFPDCTQGDGLLDDIIVIRYLSSGYKFLKGPAVLMSDQIHGEQLTG